MLQGLGLSSPRPVSQLLGPALQLGRHFRTAIRRTSQLHQQLSQLLDWHSGVHGVRFVCHFSQFPSVAPLSLRRFNDFDAFNTDALQWFALLAT